MLTLCIILLFAIVIILLLLWMELKRFVDYVTTPRVPLIQQSLYQHTSPAPKNIDIEEPEREILGFQSPKKKKED